MTTRFDLPVEVAHPMPQPRVGSVLPPPVALGSFLAALKPEYSEIWVRARAGATVRCFRHPHGARPSIVVKELTAHEEDPAEMAVTHLMLEADASAGNRPMVAPKLVAYGDDPPFVAYEFIEGRLLKDMIVTATDGSTSVHRERLIDLARRSGAAMARFHGAFGPPGPQDRADDRLSESRLASRSLTLGGVKSPDLSAWVRSMIDPGPHNLVVDLDDQVLIIDLPAAAVFRPREAELGMLAQRFGRLVRRSARLSQRPTRGAARRIASAVVDGYQREYRGPLERSLVEVYIGVSSALYALSHATRVRSVASMHEVASDGAWFVGSIVRARTG